MRWGCITRRRRGVCICAFFVAFLFRLFLLGICCESIDGHNTLFHLIAGQASCLNLSTYMAETFLIALTWAMHGIVNKRRFNTECSSLFIRVMKDSKSNAMKVKNALGSYIKPRDQARLQRTRIHHREVRSKIAMIDHCVLRLLIRLLVLHCDCLPLALIGLWGRNGLWAISFFALLRCISPVGRL